MPAPIVIHVPHASAVIPPGERQDIVLDAQQLSRELICMTDWYTDELFAVGDLPVRVIRFPVSRLVVDPERFEDPSLEPMESRGMGAVYTATSQQKPLRSAITQDLREQLLERYFRPHHRALSTAVSEAIRVHGRCLVLDAHSFPAEPLPYEMDQELPRPEICIGTDSYHTPDWLQGAAVEAYRRRGYHVEVNRPFAGALVPIERYRKDKRVLSVMLELNRGLYLDGDSGDKSEGFEATLNRNHLALADMIEAFVEKAHSA